MDFQVNSSSKKKNFKFNEVASMTSVKPYVLRFWESEFPQINVQMNDDGSKFYTLDSLKVVEKIKELLFEKKLSIPEAKSWLDINLELVFMEELPPPVIEDFEMTSLSNAISSDSKVAASEKNQAISLSSSLDQILNRIDSILEKRSWF